MRCVRVRSPRATGVNREHEEEGKLERVVACWGVNSLTMMVSWERESDC